MELLLGIDFGTSYFKLGLFDREGVLRGLGRAAVKTEGVPPRAEMPVERFWAALRKGLRQALDAAKAEAGDIAAVSYSSQANTFLLLDSADETLTPLIFWTDLRADPVEPALARLRHRSWTGSPGHHSPTALPGDLAADKAAAAA